MGIKSIDKMFARDTLSLDVDRDRDGDSDRDRDRELKKVIVQLIFSPQTSFSYAQCSKNRTLSENSSAEIKLTHKGFVFNKPNLDILNFELTETARSSPSIRYKGKNRNAKNVGIAVCSLRRRKYPK